MEISLTNKQRQSAKSIVLILISFVLIGCGGAATTADNKKEIESNHLPGTPDNSQEFISEDRNPIIEIWQELDGSVPIRGTSLYFRMFYDGVVEFDNLLRRENQSRKIPYTFSIERTPPTKISDEEFRKIRSLLEDLKKSKDIKKEYKGVALTLDTSVKLTILMNENGATKRKIILNDSDYDVINSKFENTFPKLLINLIKEIHSMRLERG